MELFDLIKKRKEIFVIDDIEDKKTKTLINDINDGLVAIIEKAEEFLEFSKSQLNGEYNHKIAMAKGLNAYYDEWSAISNACANLKKEEEVQISKFDSFKNNVVSKLKTLLTDCSKLPVVSAYDVFDGDFIASKEGHVIIILGKNNTQIIETIIDKLQNEFVVTGNYDDVAKATLKANYITVDNNVKLCKEKIDEVLGDKASKADKMLAVVDTMEDIARDLVFFETYKAEMISIGCTSKEVDVYEKNLLKKYVPLKKQLQKVLKIKFGDISHVFVNEEEYSESSTNDDIAFDFNDFLDKN